MNLPLRVAFGNEATDRDIAEFARRFGCRVVDSFGSSEFAVSNFSASNTSQAGAVTCEYQ